MGPPFYRNRLRVYALAAAVTLAAWSALDLTRGGENGDAALHAMLALGAAALCAVPPARARAATGAHAAALLGLAALALFTPTLFGYGRAVDLRLDMLESLAHVALGARGARVAATAPDAPLSPNE